MNQLEITKDQLIYAPPYQFNRSNSGYGSKIRTAYKIRHNNRLKRVYAIHYCNSASYYILSNKETINIWGEGLTS